MLPQAIGGRGVVAAALVVLVLSGGLVAGVGTSAAASDVYVTVSAVEVSDDEPTVGDAVTVTPTIRHSSNADGGFQITEVSLELPGRGEVARVEDVGAISAGETLDVPLQATVQTAGERRAVVQVRGVKEDADGEFERIGLVQRPVYLSVSEPSTDSPAEPRVVVEAGTAVAGADVPVTVTVSNGEDDAIDDLAVRLSALEDTVDPQTAVRPSLDAGNATTFAFTVEPTAAGETTLEATVRSGDDALVEAYQPVQVEQLREAVDVYASVIEDNDTSALQYRVTNAGNAPVQDVRVAGTANGSSLPSASVAAVAPSSTETVTIPLDSLPTTTAALTASYTTGGQSGESSTTVSLGGTGDDVRGATPDQAGMLPLAGFSLAVLGLVGVTLVGYRQWTN